VIGVIIDKEAIDQEINTGKIFLNSTKNEK
jgi:hypothetical protein